MSKIDDVTLQDEGPAKRWQSAKRLFEAALALPLTNGRHSWPRDAATMTS